MTTDTRKRPTGRHTRRWAALAAAGALAMTGCGAVGSGDSDSDSSQPKDRAESAAEHTSGSAATEGGNAASADNQKKTPEGTHVARTASLSMTVKDVGQASAKVRSAADRAGGYVSSEESHTTLETDAEETKRSADTTTDTEPRLSTRSWAEITVTVPVDELVTTMTKLAEVGDVTRRTSDTEDLSTQYTDTAARVRTKKTSIERLQKLISSTEDLDQIVTLEDELAQREADLESMTSQQKSLEKRTTTAPITISLATQDVAVDRDSSGEVGFVAGLSKGWTGFTSALEVGLTALGAATPFAVTGLVIVGPFVWWLRRRTRRSLPAPVATTTE